MKRIFTFCLCVLAATISILAQDIIVTTNAQKIEAKILEVSKTEIKYKESDNLDGPTFILEIKEISSIIYSNGKVVLYTQDSNGASIAAEPSDSKAQAESQKQETETEQATNPTTEENTAEILLLSGNTITAPLIEMKSNYVSCVLNGKTEMIPASQIEKVTILANGQVREYNGQYVDNPEGTNTTNTTTNSTSPSSSGRIYRDNGQYLHNDVYISSKEVERILQRENPAAHKEWQKAEGLLIGGSICTGIGGGMVIGGLFTLFFNNYKACLGIECGALVPLGVGLGLTLSSSTHYNKAIDIYNSKYDHAAVQLKWHVAPTEVGLALVF